jgi:hypothetical protein
MSATGRLKKNAQAEKWNVITLLTSFNTQHGNPKEPCSALATANMHHNDHCATVLSAAGGMLSAFESCSLGTDPCALLGGWAGSWGRLCARPVLRELGHGPVCAAGRLGRVVGTFVCAPRAA